ncbi:Bud-site selection protein [Clathrospora elynae]|uniref:Bud-site selection protein n=1 Tax=Clathrospora elynae TaxID=706981 RepID=A0A6A5S8H3_9PLEO|nr:Bud-site selection protein [Clathrospora elynae]
MLKRKRDPPPATAKGPLSPSERIQKHVNDCLAAAQKPLLAALRHGASLERQKHSRRKKHATNKNEVDALRRLGIEYEVLKALNLEQLADQHLRKTLAKVTSLKDAEQLQEYLGGIREGSKDAATLNVTARVYKMPSVKKIVDSVIADLKSILGVAKGVGKAQDGKEEGAKKPKSAKAAEYEDEVMQDASDGDDDPYMAFSARIAAPSSGEDDSEASVSGDERPPSIGDSDSEHDPDDDLEAESASSEASIDDLGSEEEIAKSLSRSIAPPADYSYSASSTFDSDSDSNAASIPTKKLKIRAALPADAKPTSSAFLPALSHGAYFSGSESEASDLDADIAPRKNRRGQKARQKIAEAKFGAKAKHLEKEQRNAGWDPKRGAVGDDTRSRRRGAPTGRGPQQSGGNAEPVGGAKKEKSAGVNRDDKGDLHPSWLAAKAAKESKRLKIDLKGGKPQGTKVVFD